MRRAARFLACPQVKPAEGGRSRNEREAVSLSEKEEAIEVEAVVSRDLFRTPCLGSSWRMDIQRSGSYFREDAQALHPDSSWRQSVLVEVITLRSGLEAGSSTGSAADGTREAASQLAFSSVVGQTAELAEIESHESTSFSQADLRQVQGRPSQGRGADHLREPKTQAATGLRVIRWHASQELTYRSRSGWRLASPTFSGLAAPSLMSILDKAGVDPATKVKDSD